MSSNKKKKTTTYRPKGSIPTKTTKPIEKKPVASSIEQNPNKPAPVAKSVNNQKPASEIRAEIRDENKKSIKETIKGKTHEQSSNHLTTKQKWIWAICTIGACLLIGLFAKLLGGDMKHFEEHTLPPLTAPVWLFPIAWGILYVLIGIAGFLVFTSSNQTNETRKWDIIWFAINLVLNMIWPLFFYRLDMLILSTILCAFVVITAAIVCYRFYYRNLAGGILYSIYVAWLLYAFYLNLGITLLNV